MKASTNVSRPRARWSASREFIANSPAWQEFRLGRALAKTPR